MKLIADTTAMHERTSIDPGYVAMVAQKVIERLRSMQVATIKSGVIDAKTIIEIAPNTTLVVDIRSVLTPSAIDEARQRKITIERVSTATSKPRAIGRQPNKTDERREAIFVQLAHRGITSIKAEVILSDTPARDVATVFGQSRRGVMIGSIDDVTRFQVELAPEVWVLDMKKLNLVAAVNVIAAIERLKI